MWFRMVPLQNTMALHPANNPAFGPAFVKVSLSDTTDLTRCGTTMNSSSLPAVCGRVMRTLLTTRRASMCAKSRVNMRQQDKPLHKALQKTSALAHNLYLELERQAQILVTSWESNAFFGFTCRSHPMWNDWNYKHHRP